MDLKIGQLTPFPVPARPRAGTTGTASPAAAFALPRTDTVTVTGGVPASPPPEVLDEVARAADRAAELARENRELHFSVDEDTGRVVIQVRDLDGNVIRTIPGTEALEVMSGADL
jgi:hypothetical protein